jgi:hypothetical protein
MDASGTSDTVEGLVARLADLERLVGRQQAQISGQAVELAQLRRTGTVAVPSAPGVIQPDVLPPPGAEEAPTPTGRRSRRALLKLGGAAAAAGVAATAALVAGEGGQTAHAADGDSLLIGSANLGTKTTRLAIAGSSFTSYCFFVDASGSSNPFVIAIEGYANVANGTGVSAYGGGVGVSGGSTSGTGTYGASSTGTGVHGVGLDSTVGVGGFFEGVRAPLSLGQGGAPGAPSANQHYTGDIYADQHATLWVCIADGIPGTWVRLASVPNGTLGGTISYLSTPIRLLDARSGASSGLVNRGPLAGNEVLTFAVAGLAGSGIPSNAQGLIGNVTILGPSAAGNLSLFPAGGAAPTVASMTFGTAGLFLANGVNVAIGSGSGGASGGAINIQNQSNGTTPLVLDAVAYVS